ncbi:hypothetical protein ACSMCQ_14795, partial [Salmonella enterica]
MQAWLNELAGAYRRVEVMTYREIITALPALPADGEWWRRSLRGVGRQRAPSTLSLYIDLCNCLILICSIQHQMKVNLW